MKRLGYRHAYRGPDYAFNWQGLPDRTLPAAESRELGSLGGGLSGETIHGGMSGASIVESSASYDKHWPPLARLRSRIAVSGGEPEPLGLFGTLSNNERRLLWLASGVGALWWFWKRSKKR